LLERESRRQRAEPLPNASERSTSRPDFVARRHPNGELECAPGDGAVGSVNQFAKPFEAVLAHIGIGILRVPKQPRLDDTKVRRRAGAAYVLNRSHETVASSRVVVERQNNGVEAESPKSDDCGRLHTGAADGSDGRVSPGAEVMDIDEPLNEDEVATIGCR